MGRNGQAGKESSGRVTKARVKEGLKRWCTDCGNMWRPYQGPGPRGAERVTSYTALGASPCQHDNTDAFADGDAADAAYITGGTAAVWAMEQELFRAWTAQAEKTRADQTD